MCVSNIQNKHKNVIHLTVLHLVKVWSVIVTQSQNHVHAKLSVNVLLILLYITIRSVTVTCVVVSSICEVNIRLALMSSSTALYSLPVHLFIILFQAAAKLYSALHRIMV